VTDALSAVATLVLLAAPPEATPPRPKAAETCATCHGPDGQSVDARIPSLAGQQAIYLSLQLVQYREERRKDAQMSPVAAKLTDAEIKELGAYYASLPPFASRRAADPALAALGKKVSDAQHCGSCHLADLSGQKQVPRLVGQQHDYLLTQMRAFKDQNRADLDGSMTMAAQPLSPRDIEEVAEYISSLRPSH
jgi:cytochrome c553